MEDEIEMERQRKVAEFKASGKKGTPVTPESFKIWQDKKRKARAEAAKKLVENEMKKKKGGKGLAVLSGRDLYEYKASLFDVGNDEEDVDTSGAEPQDDDNENENDEQNGEKMNGDKNTNGDDVENVAAKVQSDLFLEGDDDDLDDLDDD